MFDQRLTVGRIRAGLEFFADFESGLPTLIK